MAAGLVAGPRDTRKPRRSACQRFRTLYRASTRKSRSSKHSDFDPPPPPQVMRTHLEWTLHLESVCDLAKLWVCYRPLRIANRPRETARPPLAPRILQALRPLQAWGHSVEEIGGTQRRMLFLRRRRCSKSRAWLLHSLSRLSTMLHLAARQICR